jgi:DNA-binding IclR family transcriptional regulator
VFDALRIVAAASEPVGASDIARQLGLPASTVYRALITLEESEYIDRFQSSARYELGAMPRLLNRALLRRFTLQRESAPLLRLLAEESGETASVSVRLGWYSLRIAVAYGSHDFYHRDRLGEVTPLHASLPSRVILGALGDSALMQYWAFAEKYFKPTSAERKLTHSSAQSLRRDGVVIEAIAASSEKAAVGAPLRNGNGEVIGALVLHGPIVKSGATSAPASFLSARKSLEASIAAAPQRFASPFAHLNPNDIRIALPPSPSFD